MSVAHFSGAGDDEEFFRFIRRLDVAAGRVGAILDAGRRRRGGFVADGLACGCGRWTQTKSFGPHPEAELGRIGPVGSVLSAQDLDDAFGLPPSDCLGLGRIAVRLQLKREKKRENVEG